MLNLLEQLYMYTSFVIYILNVLLVIIKFEAQIFKYESFLDNIYINQNQNIAILTLFSAISRSSIAL